MFEEIAAGASKFLVILFWIFLLIAIIWGYMWIHELKKSKVNKI
jgi:preprotein translocase subunit SecG